MATSSQIPTVTPTRGKTSSGEDRRDREPADHSGDRPDRVFPGLMVGASLGPPKVRPPYIAAESQTQVTMSGKKTSQAPAQLRTGSWAVPNDQQKDRQRAGIQHPQQRHRDRLERPVGRRARGERPGEQPDEPDAPRRRARCDRG